MGKQKQKIGPSHRSKKAKGKVKSLEELFFQQKGRCKYCGMPMILENGNVNGMAATIDHKIPQVLHGHNGSKNTVAACQKCNAKKAHMSPEEFKEYLKDMEALKCQSPIRLSIG